MLGACQLTLGPGPVASPPISSGTPGTPSEKNAIPVATPASTPMETANPVASPSGKVALSVSVAPATGTVAVAAPRGKLPAGVTSLKLEAAVSHSDGSRDKEVLWSSAEGDRASVDQDGTVKAGLEPGDVKIFATSKDGRAKGFATITVLVDAAAEVDVE